MILLSVSCSALAAGVAELSPKMVSSIYNSLIPLEPVALRQFDGLEARDG
jgi:hypothetical protein